MELTRYENTFAPHLCALLEDDRYAFAVLGSIISGKMGVVSRIVTDNARLLLAYTCHPFPAWTWTHEGATQEEMAFAWKLMREELPPEEGFCFNVREQLAAYIMSREDGQAMRVHRNLNAYRCEQVIAPKKAAEGDYYAVGREMLQLAAFWSQAMSEETNLDLRPYSMHEEEIGAFIDRKRLFMWKTPEGVPVAMCSVQDEDGVGYVSHVYTSPEHRRRGYAAQLVYCVTKAMLAQGMRAGLYTDANYPPSNACYQQIGYVKEDAVCTIGL